MLEYEQQVPAVGMAYGPGRIFLEGRTIYIQEMDDGSELFVKHADDDKPHII
jgi:hypothetical protein